MSEQNSSEPDPEPDRTPGLDDGGSVPPGETPPESASATEGLSHTSRPSAQASKWVWLAAITIVVLLVAAFFVFLAVGWVR
ncbi:hypothetical protein SAMN02982929_00905 [Saccharopolyspora kobensis]|uniref:Uncharacterized protein n=1 Tax=Saccharopolyspora kobensis TaxID=146035 RepID=A0A1H5VJW0_9PSEU|nr:DUF6480 family protein [Saccharopolyspora kobensis]SEF87635.1 hypothetical protein SAMN02982929_00905 [Saccharopolyspora kobensis]SFC59983.1 hypothetical protein SAMN05216506_1011165 [Saccharopolyspora kobensis]